MVYSGTVMGVRSVEVMICHSFCPAGCMASVSVHSVITVIVTVEASGGVTVS